MESKLKRINKNNKMKRKLWTIPKNPGDQAKEAPNSSDTQDLLWYQIRITSSPGFGCINLGESENSQLLYKMREGARAYYVWAYYDTTVKYTK